ncbi:MAG: hypothetical protein JWL90_272 [Chthoniobacteraceae bacterium]|nr:hypothetical protein [Chthoniobacteraceae bacterium]
MAFHFHKALAHGFDKTDASQPFSERRKQTERGGGLAVVLLRGGDKKPWGGCIQKEVVVNVRPNAGPKGTRFTNAAFYASGSFG